MENDNTRAALEAGTQRILEALNSLEVAPSVQMQTGNPGTRRNPGPLFADSDEDDDSTQAYDYRPVRNRRQHLAEYFEEDDAEGDRLDSDIKGREFEEPPSDDDGGL